MSPLFRLRAAFAALMAFALLVLPASVAQAQITPLISAYVGTQTATSRLGFLVLDFNDAGPNPERYAFGYYYEGNPSNATLLQLLQATLTGPNGFQQTGAANNRVSLLGYNNRVKFNDFAGNNSGEPNGYWNLWLGFDGVTWANSNFGTRDATFSDTPVFSTNPFSGTQELSGASWHGWRWVGDFNTETAQAPRTPLAASVAAPEPATALLLLPIVAGAVVRRRRHRSL